MGDVKERLSEGGGRRMGNVEEMENVGWASGMLRNK